MADSMSGVGNIQHGPKMLCHSKIRIMSDTDLMYVLGQVRYTAQSMQFILLNECVQAQTLHQVGKEVPSGDCSLKH